jgi:hypothetical protein
MKSILASLTIVPTTELINVNLTRKNLMKNKKIVPGNSVLRQPTDSIQGFRVVCSMKWAPHRIRFPANIVGTSLASL